jgi:hypothetical protein
VPTGRSPATAWPSFADGDLRADRNRSSARTARHPGQQDDGAEEQDTAGLSTPHVGHRQVVSRWHQHAPSPPRTRGAVWLFGGQGHGESDVAERRRRVEGLCPGLKRQSLRYGTACRFRSVRSAIDQQVDLCLTWYSQNAGDHVTPNSNTSSDGEWSNSSTNVLCGLLTAAPVIWGTSGY